MAVHIVKTWRTVFQDVWDKRKPFEVRRDDRGYAVGDLLIQREFNAGELTFTGRYLIGELQTMPIERLSSKLFRTHRYSAEDAEKYQTDEGGHVAHWCPGCNTWHHFAVDRPFRNGARWTWDGNLDAPTFNPSMNIRVGPMPNLPEGRPDAGKIKVCHYFLHGGNIQFLGDCTHPLAGQTVPLPDLPEKM